MEVMASVRLLFIDFDVQCRSFSDDQKFKNGIAMSALGASCLKKKAELATETWCFSVSIYLLHSVQSPIEENCIYILQTIVKTFPVETKYFTSPQ
jgi:hypothetical protein